MLNEKQYSESSLMKLLNTDAGEALWRQEEILLSLFNNDTHRRAIMSVLLENAKYFAKKTPSFEPFLRKNSSNLTQNALNDMNVLEELHALNKTWDSLDFAHATVLLRAVLSNQEKAVQDALRLGARINERELLHVNWADHKSSVKTLRLLIDAKNEHGWLMDLNKMFRLVGETLRTRGAIEDETLLRLLIDAKDEEGTDRLDLNMNNIMEDYTLAYIAASVGCVKTTRLLMDSKDKHGSLRVDFNRCNRRSQTTPIHVAVTKGHVDVVLLFISARDQDNAFCVELDKRTYHGYTPILIAAENGLLDIFRLLMDAKNDDDTPRTDFNSRTNTGLTLPFIAAQRRHYNDGLCRLMKDKAKSGALCFDLDKNENKRIISRLFSMNDESAEILRLSMTAKNKKGAWRVNSNENINTRTTPGFFVPSIISESILRRLLLNARNIYRWKQHPLDEKNVKAIESFFSGSNESAELRCLLIKARNGDDTEVNDNEITRQAHV